VSFSRSLRPDRPLEAGPWSFDETLVAPFREHAFEVGGRTRAAATFAYPNTAGGFLVLALAPTLYFALRERSRAIAAVAACGIVAAILLTYSRGALIGAAASSATLWWLVRSRPLLWLDGALIVAAFAPSNRVSAGGRRARATGAGTKPASSLARRRSSSSRGSF
jgi:hypothetical protein